MEDEQSVSYEMLLDLLRQERRSNKPVPLREGFWLQLREYLQDLEEEFRGEQQKDPFSRTVMLLMDRTKHSLDAAEAIWTLRERKLVMLATAHTRSTEVPLGITQQELALYELLRQELRKGRARMFDGTANAKPYQNDSPLHHPMQAPTTPTPVSVPKREPAPAAVPDVPVADEPDVEEGVDPGFDDGFDEPMEPMEPADDLEHDEPADWAPPMEDVPPAAAPEPAEAPAIVEVPGDTPDAEVVLIRATSDIPTFVAPDLQTYDLASGTMATVPKHIADLLVRRGKAVIVDAQ